MDFLDWTCDSPAENLALDEALLLWAESRGGNRLFADGFSRPCSPIERRDGPNLSPPNSKIEWLRLWEPAKPFVVLGRSSRLEQEVDLVACRRAELPILRRSSGGAAVVVGPGCLMYTVVLSYDLRPPLRALDQAHRLVLDQHVAMLHPWADQVRSAGTSDLVFGEPARKFSGNSLRCKRTHLVYHGTLLYDFELPLIARSLRVPPRQPEYRAGRDHAQFVANFPIAGTALRQAIQAAWLGRQPTSQLPGGSNLGRGPAANRPNVPLDELLGIANTLVEDRYAQATWTYCFP